MVVLAAAVALTLLTIVALRLRMVSDEVWAMLALGLSSRAAAEAMREDVEGTEA